MRFLIWLAASSAAMALRSVPDEAAVAEVFGTLPVLLAVICTRSTGMPKASANTCATLMWSPCHLGAAVAEMDRAVAIDVHQRARLVVPGRGERDAEFDGRHGDALLQHPALLVVGEHGLAALLVVRRFSRSRITRWMTLSSTAWW